MSTFVRNVAEWLPPGIITCFLERSKRIGIVKLRENRKESRRVARMLIDQKREGPAVGGDILSLLGLSLSSRSRNDAKDVI